MFTPDKKLLITFDGADAGDFYSAFYEIDLWRMTCARTIEVDIKKFAERRSGKLIRIASK